MTKAALVQNPDQPTPNVAYVLPEVASSVARWKVIRDCIAGQDAIKAATSDYLPMPNADDLSEQNRARYLAYMTRAVFYNVTGRTHRGLVSLAFSEEPTIQIAPQLEGLLTNVDGAGISLEQQARATLGEVASTGRCGLLVDYPPVAAPVSKAQLAAFGLQPTIRRYEPQDIINWRVDIIGGLRVLALVVLQESVAVPTDDFVSQIVKQWRVLRLVPNEAGVFRYVVTVYQMPTNASQMGYTAITALEQYEPLDFKGAPWSVIPFMACGSENNEISVDSPPLLDLANLNVAHYRNSADYEESVFMCGQPTPTLTGMTKPWWEDVLNKTVRLGSRSAVPLPPGAELKLVQAEANMLVREAMQDKERQMVALGARLIQTNAVQRTATEAKIESASELSVLSTCANNVAAGYTQALKWAGMFAGAKQDSVFKMHPNADLDSLSIEERAQLMAEMQDGGISWTEYRDHLRSSGVATQDDAKAKAEIEAAKPKQPAPIQIPAVTDTIVGKVK
jgi:hypothetical protein